MPVKCFIYAHFKGNIHESYLSCFLFLPNTSSNQFWGLWMRKSNVDLETGLMSGKQWQGKIMYMYRKKESEVTQSCPTLCDPMDCLRNSPGQNTGVSSLSLLQGISPTQGLNPGLLALQVDSLPAGAPWKPTPVLLLGKSHGRRSLVGYSPWGRKE